MIEKSIFKDGANKNLTHPDTNKGITLIALVITIIVMLILVAVTMTMAVNGGLFEYAGRAGSETNEAVKAEQQLASGKLQIDGKWYASIDDYLNNEPIETGIVITPTKIPLTKKETQDVTGEEKTTETITATLIGMESEPEITWETSSDVITLSSTKGKSITITAAGTTNATAKVTAKCTYEGKEYSENCEVKLEILKKQIEVAKGDFVEYGVAYTDAFFENYTYTTTNGWRLLDYTANEDGTISNVKLISTGIPAKLASGTSNNDWWVTEESSQDSTEPNLTDFLGVLGYDKDDYPNNLSQYQALKKSAGLYYNFGNIKFAHSTISRGDNLGYFTSITVYDDSSESGVTYNSSNAVEKTGNELFKVGNNVKSIRLLIPSEACVFKPGWIVNYYSTAIELANLYDVGRKIDGYNYDWPYCPMYLAGCTSNNEENEWDNNVMLVVVSMFEVMQEYNTSSYGGSERGVRPVICFDDNASFGVSSDANGTYLILTPKN